MDIENITGIQHIGIPTKDLQATEDFFGKLGFKNIWSVHDETRNVAFLQLENIVIETYLSDTTAGAPGAVDHIAINVKDVEKAYADIAALGMKSLEGKICFLPFFEKGVRFFTVMGPDAEKIEFNQML